MRLVIRGRVQGVGYRAWLADQARHHGLVGWVRNCRDGTVEAWLQGDDAAVVGVAEACRRGPHHAAVTEVERHPEAEGTLMRFAIARDAAP